MSGTSSEHLMYVQFTFCPQGLFSKRINPLFYPPIIHDKIKINAKFSSQVVMKSLEITQKL